MHLIKVPIADATAEIEHAAAAGLTPEVVDRCMKAIEPTLRAIQWPVLSYDVRGAVRRLLESGHPERAVEMLIHHRTRRWFQPTAVLVYALVIGGIAVAWLRGTGVLV